MELAAVLERLQRDASFSRIANNPLAQFGVPGRQYLGARFLPEVLQSQNEYRELGMKYRTVIANHADRFSPVQRKRGVLSGWMRVTLGESDIGSDIDGRDYDALLAILNLAGGGANPPLSAVDRILQWVDLTLVRPLLERNEKDRWDAIFNGAVVLSGDNNYTETVSYNVPTGHHFNVGGDFDNDAYDPYDDYIAAAALLRSKGFEPVAIVQHNTVTQKLMANDKIKIRLGWPRLTAAGLVAQVPGQAQLADINAMFGRDNLPPITEYNLQYRIQATSGATSGYFIPIDKFAMIGATMSETVLDRADAEPIIIQNTIGYLGVGRPAGQSGPGRVIKTKHIEDEKPPHVDGQAWQTSLPVILEPESIVVAANIV